MDSFPFREWPGAPTVPLHVYRASIELRRGQTIVLARTLFQLDMEPGPIWQHLFRPLTRRSAPIAVCIVREPADCNKVLWIRLWERGWNTRKVPNGSYTLKLTVEHRRAECQQDPAAPGRELIQTLFATMTSIDSAARFPTMSQAVTVSRKGPLRKAVVSQ